MECPRKLQSIAPLSVLHPSKALAERVYDTDNK